MAPKRHPPSAPKPPPPAGSASDDSSLVSASAQGAKFLILLQVASRLLTFVVNQLLLQFLSPAQLGLSVQFELFTISILYFSRESLRNALQRQKSSGEGIDSTLKDAPSSPSPSRIEKRDNTGVVQAPLLEGTRAGDAQTVVNLSALTIPLGIIFSIILGIAYTQFMASPEASGQPYFYLSVSIYMVATMIELLAEPGFAISQQMMLYKTRASAEWRAAFGRCIITFAATAAAWYLGLNLGPLPFALGQVAYGALILSVYATEIWPISESVGFRMGLKMIKGKK